MSDDTVQIALSKPDEALSLTQVIKASKGSASIVSTRISELKEANWIKELYEAKFGGRRLISLTEKGNAIAKHLLKIEMELNK